MWTCEQCGERIDDQFETCWKCAPTAETQKPTKRRHPRMRCHFVRSAFNSWDGMFADACEFATEIGPDRLVNISHSSDRGTGVIAIWYWSDV